MSLFKYKNQVKTKEGVRGNVVLPKGGVIGGKRSGTRRFSLKIEK